MSGLDVLVLFAHQRHNLSLLNL